MLISSHLVVYSEVHSPVTDMLAAFIHVSLAEEGK